MSPERLAKIRQRLDWFDTRPSTRTANAFWDANEDRRGLLAEVDRLTRERDEARAALAATERRYADETAACERTYADMEAAYLAAAREREEQL